MRDGDRAALLGDHQAECVAAFGQPERRGVAGSSRPEFASVFRQRQMDGKTLQPVFPHHQRPVVTGRSRAEQAVDEFLADGGLQYNPALQEPVERFPSGQDHQGAPPIRRQAMHRANQYRQAPPVGPRYPSAQAQCGNLLEEPPQVVLEDNNQQHDEDGKKTLEYPRRQLQFELARQEIEGAQKRQPGQRHAGVHPSGPGQQPPEQHAHDRYVHDI